MLLYQNFFLEKGVRNEFSSIGSTFDEMRKWKLKVSYSAVTLLSCGKWSVHYQCSLFWHQQPTLILHETVQTHLNCICLLFLLLDFSTQVSLQEGSLPSKRVSFSPPNFLCTRLVLTKKAGKKSIQDISDFLSFSCDGLHDMCYVPFLSDSIKGDHAACLLLTRSLDVKLFTSLQSVSHSYCDGCHLRQERES